MAERDPLVSINDIPTRLLNMRERMAIATLMDEIRIRETEDTRLPRDFRGLGQLMGFEAREIKAAENTLRPTEELLYKWEEDESNTIGKLLDFFEQLGRFDVIDDLQPLLEERRPEILRRYSSTDSTVSRASSKSFSESLSYQLDIVNRKEWGASSARVYLPLTTPVRLVFIHHTGKCKNEGYDVMTELQEEYMALKGSVDIAYNFVINCEGTIFEGTGWENVCGHSFRYVRISLSFALVGDFDEEMPTDQMMNSLKNLLDAAVELNYLEPDYGLYSYKDFEVCTTSPGANVMEIIRTWPNYQAKGEIRDLTKFRDGLPKNKSFTV